MESSAGFSIGTCISFNTDLETDLKFDLGSGYFHRNILLFIGEYSGVSTVCPIPGELKDTAGLLSEILPV